MKPADATVDAMVDAAKNELIRPPHYSETLWVEDIRDALAAALAAMPTVGGRVWCADEEAVIVMDLWGNRTICRAEVFGNDCPGPHHTLIIGPEVTS